jgi:DNA polymerase III delta subunit
MKIMPSKLDKYLENVAKEAVCGCLIYGEDEGVQKDRIDKITHSLKKSSPELEKIVLDGNDGASVEQAIEEACTDSFFGYKKLIIFYGISASDAPIIEAFEERLDQVKFNSFVIFVGSASLDGRSKLVTMFNNSKTFVNVPCYADVEAELMQIIKERLDGYEASVEVVKNISSKFKGNRAVLLSEIDKLKTFKGTDKTVLIDDVSAVIVEGVEDSLFEVAVNLASFDINLMERGFAQMKNTGTPFAVIISLFTIHLQKLERMLLGVQEGGSVDGELGKEYVNFKQVATFKKQLKIWSLDKIAECYKGLARCELQSRQFYDASDVIVENFFLLWILKLA